MREVCRLVVEVEVVKKQVPYYIEI